MEERNYAKMGNTELFRMLKSTAEEHEAALAEYKAAMDRIMSLKEKYYELYLVLKERGVAE